MRCSRVSFVSVLGRGEVACWCEAIPRDVDGGKAVDKNPRLIINAARILAAGKGGRANWLPRAKRPHLQSPANKKQAMRERLREGALLDDASSFSATCLTPVLSSRSRFFEMPLTNPALPPNL